MQTQSEIRSLDPKLRKIANRLGTTGWISFGLQLVLAIAAGVALGYSISSSDLNEATTPGIAVGVFWAICGIIVLFGGVYLAFRFTQIARQIRRSDAKKQLQKTNVLALLRAAVTVGLVGMLLMILGEGVTLGALFVKAIGQPKPGAIYEPTQLIRSLDIAIAMANMSGITGHFVATLVSLGLLSNLSRQ